MANPVYGQIPIRLQLGVISNPPTAPVDRNTGAAPRAWVGNTVAVDVGVFDANSVGVDLTNLAYLQVIVQEDEESDAPVAVVQIDAAQIVKTITIADWIAGTAQNARALFDAAATGVAMQGRPSRDFWIIVAGFLGSGAPIIYGAGTFTFFEPGGSLPKVTPTLTSRHEQATVAGDFTVAPTSQIHVEVVDVSGVARTVNGLLAINGIQDGARLDLVFNLPATANIIINIKNVINTNPTIWTVGTGDVLKTRVQLYYDANAAAWVPFPTT